MKKLLVHFLISISFISVAQKVQWPPGAYDNQFKLKKLTDFYYDGFEGNELGSAWAKELAREETMQLTSKERRSGNQCLNIKITPKDSATGANRVELVYHPLDSNNSETWYSFSFKIPKGFFAEDDKKGIVMLHQWHDQPSPLTNWETYYATYPPVGMFVSWSKKEQKYKLVIAHGLRTTTENKSLPVAIFDLEEDRWIDMSFHIKWSQYSDGFIEVWKDGEYISGKEGARKVFGANMYNIRPNYFKFGLYRRGERHSNKEIFLDNVMILSKKRPSH